MFCTQLLAIYDPVMKQKHSTIGKFFKTFYRNKML